MIHIRGLVRKYNEVRRALSAGIPPDRHEGFRGNVRSAIAETERICAECGTTPSRLPGPSLNAYRFLKELDLDNLPEPTQSAGGTAPRVPSIRNVTAMTDFLSRRLWYHTDAVAGNSLERNGLVTELARQADTIERICKGAGVSPSQLTPVTRQAFCWMRFLSSHENLGLHLDALGRAHAVAPAARAGAGMPVEVHLVNMSNLWRRLPYRDVFLLKVSEGFLHAPESLWADIMKYAFPVGSRVDRRAKDVVHDFASSDDFRDVMLSLETFAAPDSGSTRGMHHDLEASFDRVNREYFGGKMPRPMIRWGRSLPSLKFGHYEHSRDTVMLSATLDSPDVPQFVLDNVMFHELLHKVHGFVVSNGRRLSHTAAFAADARKFSRYDEAEGFLDKLACKLWRRSR